MSQPFALRGGPDEDPMPRTRQMWMDLSGRYRVTLPFAPPSDADCARMVAVVDANGGVPLSPALRIMRVHLPMGQPAVRALATPRVRELIKDGAHVRRGHGPTNRTESGVFALQNIRGQPVRRGAPRMRGIDMVLSVSGSAHVDATLYAVALALFAARGFGPILPAAPPALHNLVLWARLPGRFLRAAISREAARKTARTQKPFAAEIVQALYTPPGCGQTKCVFLIFPDGALVAVHVSNETIARTLIMLLLCAIAPLFRPSVIPAN